MSFSRSDLFNRLLFSPYVIVRNKQYYRFLSSALVHADYAHLAVNLIVLYSFGSYMEVVFEHWFGALGDLLYVLLFAFSTIVAHIPSYLKYRDNVRYASIGASGAVSGVLFAMILIEPFEKLYLFGILPIPGILFAILYVIYSTVMSRRGGDNINHEAHIWGGIAGMVLLLIMRPAVATHFIEQFRQLLG